VLNSKPIDLDRLVRMFFNLILVVSVFWLLNYLSDVLLPFAIALSAAYFINPLVVWFQSKTNNRNLSIGLSLLLFLILFTAGLGYTLPKVYHEFKDMMSLLEKMTQEKSLDVAAKKRLPPEIWEAIREPFQSEWLRKQVSNVDVQNVLKMSAQKLLPGLLGVIQGTASLLLSLVGLVVIGLYLIFILMDYPNYTENWKRLLPPNIRDSAGTFVANFDLALSKYFRAQILVAGIVGLLFALGFQLIGLPMALLLGVLMAILNMVPYMQILGIFPCSFLVIAQGLETGQSFWVLGGYVLIVFVVVQLIQDAILVPKIMGKVTGLSPAMILLSLSVWGKLLGLFGLVIAIPISCLCLAYYKQLLKGLENEAAS